VIAVLDTGKLLVLAAALVACLLLALGVAQVAGPRESSSALEESQDASAEAGGFANPRLESAVRGILRDAGVPFDADHLELITELRARGQGITDLRGLECCTGLERLDLSDNKIVDISPLSQLGELRTVYLADNLIRDLQPLAKLRWLADLDLSGNRVEDVSALANLTNMAHLDLSRNEIRDVGTLWELQALITLDLSENRITSVSSMPHVQPCAGPGSWAPLPARGKYVEISCADPTIDLSDNLIQDFAPLLRWLDQVFAGHAVALSGNPLDLADGSATREIIQKLESRGILVCY